MTLSWLRTFPSSDGRSDFLRSAARIVCHALCLALLAYVIAVTADRLFSGMTTVGMSGVDTFEYWKYANDIIHGEHNFVFDRLSFYAVNVLALHVLGNNDYAIRASVGLMHLIDIAMVYTFALYVSRHALVAIAAATFYAFIPAIVTYSAIELPHIAGAFFVLLTAISAVVTLDPSRRRAIRLVAAFLIGVAIAGGYWTHEDLLFLGAGYFVVVAALVAAERSIELDASILRFVLIAMVLGGLFGIAWPMVATGVGPGKVLNDFIALRSAVNQNTDLRTGGAYLANVPLRILKNFTIDTLGVGLTVVTATVAVGIPVLYIRKRSTRAAMLLSVELPILIYSVAFIMVAKIYLEGSYQRLFVPLVGPSVAFACCGSYLLLRKIVWTQLAAVAVVVGASWGIWRFQPWSFVERSETSHRRVYDAVKDLVGWDRKLLLPACFALDANWVGVGSGVYLGDNVVPIYLMNRLEKFDEIVVQHNVRYVLIVSEPLRGMWPIDKIENLFSFTYEAPLGDQIKSLSRISQEVWRGDERVDWSREVCALETVALRRLVEQRSGRLAVAVNGVGEIYELPARKPAQ